jgi:hypothetical protein
MFTGKCGISCDYADATYADELIMKILLWILWLNAGDKVVGYYGKCFN